jgi:hypothetical protein
MHLLRICSCSCGGYKHQEPCNATVGIENVTDVFLKQIPVTKDTGATVFWFLNLLEKIVGNWFTHTAKGQCGPGIVIKQNTQKITHQNKYNVLLLCP